MSTTVVFEDQAIMRAVCGANDRNIGYMELLLHGNIFVHGNSLSFEQDEESNDQKKQVFKLLMKKLKEAAAVQPDIFEPEIYMEYQQILHPSQGEADLKVDSIAVGSKVIYPKSIHQKEFINLMETKQLVFGIGPAGTGKTFLAIAYALKEVLSGRKQKIIITRPVVEAGENLGFLPGDLTQKLGPYLTPVYDAMEYLIPPHVVKRLQESESIESAPLAYMRGRSFNNACVLLDEGQNTTVEQMKMFLTRLSETSTAIVTGDITQIDLPRRKNSGLVHAARILHNVPGIGFVEFSSSDVIRSKLVQRIINAYESEPFSKE
ncbi:MAG: PhoH family protein [Sphaerochaetaceae bacterium]|nr:PhoH family protein [Sphaerochaetaceae bacterium]